MVFQGEDVPLTEDIIMKSRREFFPSFSEWVSDNNAQQILKSRVVSGGVIYTVPDNFTLFITSAWLMLRAAAVGFMYITDENIDSFLGCTANGNTASNFTMPIRVNAKQSITVTSSVGNVDVAGGFTGFLLPKKISIR